VTKSAHGKTASGEPITEDGIESRAAKAEVGYDVDTTLRRRRGRRAIGSAPAAVESVRLTPELKQALHERAHRDQQTASSIIREALRRYLAH
jgi:CRISPR-associated endonuclease/helicase Cas3